MMRRQQHKHKMTLQNQNKEDTIILDGYDGSVFCKTLHYDALDPPVTMDYNNYSLYDDFIHNSIPRIKERVKVKMAEQDIDYFDYINEDKRPPLLNKHELMAESDDNYLDQKRLDEKLIKLGVVNFAGEQYISIAEFNNRLLINNKKVRNFRLYSID